jgi:hypothetical protein
LFKDSKFYIKVLVVSSLILLLASITINIYLERVIITKINDLLDNQEKTAYQLKIGSVSSSILRNRFLIDNIDIHSIIDTTNLYEQKQLINISLNELKFEGINFASLIWDRSINIEEIVYDNLTITSTTTNLKEKTDSSKTPKGISYFKIDNLNQINVNKMTFMNSVFNLEKSNSTNHSNVIFHTTPLNFQVDDLSLKKANDGKFYLKDVEVDFNLDKGSVLFDKQNYKLSFDHFHASITDQFIKAENITIYPTLSEKLLADKFQYSQEIYHTSFDTLAITDVDLSSFLINKKFTSSSIDLSGFDVSIYKDKRKPQNKLKKIKLPISSLKQLTFPISIDQVNIRNSKITVREQIPHKDTIVQFYINRINAQINNIKNYSNENLNLNMSLQGQLMGNAPVHLKMENSLSKKDNNMFWEGYVGSFKFHTLDKVLYPILGLKILSGELHKIDFKLESDDFQSKGEMTMLYKNLHASILKSHKGSENHLLSSITNGLIHKSNPNKRGKIKTVRMSFKRDEYKGLGNYLWKTIQSGIINTITPMRKRVRKLK